MILLFFPFNSLLTTLFLINLDYLLSIDYIHCIELFFDKPNNNENTSISVTKKKPILSIDTSTTSNKTHIPQKSAPQLMTVSESPLEITTMTPKSAKVVMRKRHCSISSFNQPDTPHLSPTSSVSSFSSNWSTDSKRSHVEDMIHLFETGGNHKIHRRYSMDSHSYQKPLYIRERKYEYKPIASEWKKRTTDVHFQLSASSSTPLRRKMAPIPEKSKSTWA
ncbi:unnamed protein product [Mucor hiemalis]